MPWLDHIDEAARRIGAVNAIVVQPDGTLAGYNHDGDGFVQSVREEWPQWHPERGPVTVIGAGGAARAVVAALSARGVPEVRVVNRTLARAQTLARDLGGRVKAFPWSRRAELLGDVALLVNCTACGMIGKEELDLALDGLAPDAVVADLIYVPPQTALLARARARGHRTVNGLGMLLHQAQPAFHAWFGVMPAITPELRAAVEATFRPPVSAT
jgi:shikimate dehydrogenase